MLENIATILLTLLIVIQCNHIGSLNVDETYKSPLFGLSKNNRKDGKALLPDQDRIMHFRFSTRDEPLVDVKLVEEDEVVGSIEVTRTSLNLAKTTYEEKLRKYEDIVTSITNLRSSKARFDTLIKANPTQESYLRGRADVESKLATALNEIAQAKTQVRTTKLAVLSANKTYILAHLKKATADKLVLTEKVSRDTAEEAELTTLTKTEKYLRAKFAHALLDWTKEDSLQKEDSEESLFAALIIKVTALEDQKDIFYKTAAVGHAALKPARERAETQLNTALNLHSAALNAKVEISSKLKTAEQNFLNRKANLLLLSTDPTAYST